MSLLRLGRNEDALDSFERALALHPGYVEAHNNRATRCRACGVRRALASYDRALVLRPDYPEAHYNRGSALRQLKRDDEALAAFDKLWRCGPAMPKRCFPAATRWRAQAPCRSDRELRPGHRDLAGPSACAERAHRHDMAVCDWKRTDELTDRLTPASPTGGGRQSVHAYPPDRRSGAASAVRRSIHPRPYQVGPARAA